MAQRLVEWHHQALLTVEKWRSSFVTSQTVLLDATGHFPVHVGSVTRYGCLLSLDEHQMNAHAAFGLVSACSIGNLDNNSAKDIQTRKSLQVLPLWVSSLLLNETVVPIIVG